MSTPFKVGDKVERIGFSIGHMLHGDIHIVREVKKNGFIELEGFEGSRNWVSGRFKLVEAAPTDDIKTVLLDESDPFEAAVANAVRLARVRDNDRAEADAVHAAVMGVIRDCD